MSSCLRQFLFIVALLIGITLAPSMVASAASLIGPSWATKLVFYNGSNADVCILITVGKSKAGNAAIQDGCPLNVGQLNYQDLSGGGLRPLTMFQSPETGWFILKRGRKAQLVNRGVNPYSKQYNYCLQGLNIGFGGLPASNCPLTSVTIPNTKPGPAFNTPLTVVPPNGTNGFEMSINMPNQVNGQPSSGANESIDLTCEAGASARVVMQATPPLGGPYWNYNGGPRAGGVVFYKGTTSFKNSWVKIVSDGMGGITGCDDNCVDPATGLPRPAVFPYGCSICNFYPDPDPQCRNFPAGNPGQFCSVNNGLPANNGCQLNRSPLNNNAIQPGGIVQVQKFGGTVQINYMGPISPPASCP
jgi:hypothetical protein